MKGELKNFNKDKYPDIFVSLSFGRSGGEGSYAIYSCIGNKIENIFDDEFIMPKYLGSYKV
ncbi:MULTISPECIES: hypothetical protein [Clostridium]|jgi:hypothetical protein|uniref:Uncharacterized protein n=1 Tax=Clostridium colicanis DSM 13634 TaxID=1121305 RepID=A0A151APC5_9CLOT|nr:MULTISPECIES: hypothetical protein [Clostridium]KYH29483.1 hypothetical protein CLCOL_07140 [Clostridium colicanis DSM 13634]MBE6042766.1 hypothetical protein [Clostridium thermopalmarium]